MLRIFYVVCFVVLLSGVAFGSGASGEWSSCPVGFDDVNFGDMHSQLELRFPINLLSWSLSLFDQLASIEPLSPFDWEAELSVFHLTFKPLAWMDFEGMSTLVTCWRYLFLALICIGLLKHTFHYIL